MVDTHLDDTLKGYFYKYIVHLGMLFLYSNITMGLDLVRYTTLKNNKLYFYIVDKERLQKLLTFCTGASSIPPMGSHEPELIAVSTIESVLPNANTVMAKGDGREVGFHDGGCFLKFLKRELINNQTFITFLNWD